MTTSLIGSTPSNSIGLTLIELLITLAIATILLTVAVPSYQFLMANYELDSVTSDLASTMALSRSEAISRSSKVVICKSSDPYAAAASLACGGVWNNGWVVFVDSDNDSAYTVGETIVRRRGPVSAVSIAVPTSYTNRVTYLPIGRPSKNGTFTITDNAGVTDGATVTISSSGRVQVAK